MTSVFQVSGILSGYEKRLNHLISGKENYSEKLSQIVNDRYMGVHYLVPNDKSSQVDFAIFDSESLQRKWAIQKHMPTSSSLEEIMLAQIEESGAEVFYNLFPARFSPEFIKKLPGCVKLKLGWHASRIDGYNLSGYDLLLCNFPKILERFRSEGWSARYFFPSHDPIMNEFALNTERPIDILFAGAYSRQHLNRVKLLSEITNHGAEYNIALHFDVSRFTQLAESPLGLVGPLKKYRRPKNIQINTKRAVFGLDLYQAISRSKIVINGAIDMAGSDRGNMRCWEALGCGAMLLSDRGEYPDGFEHEKTMTTYKNENDAIRQIRNILENWDSEKVIARTGHEMIKSKYSRSVQWMAFQSLI